MKYSHINTNNIIESGLLRKHRTLRLSRSLSLSTEPANRNEYKISKKKPTGRPCDRYTKPYVFLNRVLGPLGFPTIKEDCVVFLVLVRCSVIYIFFDSPKCFALI